MNIESPVKGIVFSFFSLITGISLFLPSAEYSISMNGKSEASSMTMMPSLFSIITLILAAGCIFLVFAGLKDKCGWGSAALAVIGMINGLKFYTGLKTAALTSGAGMTTILSLFNADTPEFTVNVTWGFYIYVASLVLTVFFGIFYTLAKD